jgi:RNA polymerase sigma-70 factor (ECF subfamily)
MNGDQCALERLAEQHGHRVLAYLARRTENADDAADVFQAVLIVAWRRLRDIPAEDQQALAWMLGTARKCLANHRRGHTRRLAATDRLRATIRVSDRGASDDRSATIDQALEALGEADRELITLVYWEDLTTDQAATVLNISPTTARKRLQRSRTRIRLSLETAAAPERA